jgi:hypothetical protein
MKATEMIPQLININKREQVILEMLKAGYIPSRCHSFKPITIGSDQSSTTITYYAALDYLALGDDTDYVYMPMFPMTAQAYINSTAVYGSTLDPLYILPTKIMVDQIYHQMDNIKLDPIPISPKKGDPSRNATETYVKHNDLVQHQISQMLQKKNIIDFNKKLIVGHKKDIVLTNMLVHNEGKVAIYGWHTLNTGVPIQPLSTVHSNTYVDYSHGIRLISTSCLVNNQQHSLLEVLKDKKYATLLNKLSEGPLKVFKY